MKVLFIIYTDVEPLLKKTNMCHSNPENPSTTKINLHTACGYSLFLHCTFDATKIRLINIELKSKEVKFCKELKNMP